MSAVPKINRDAIIDIANQLFYHKGYQQTSFSQLAAACNIPKGNFYYHFKTKQAILDAVIEKRKHDIDAMLQDWDREASQPIVRLLFFIRMLKRSRTEIIRYGCPMGTINLELGKNQPKLQIQAAEMFRQFLNWLEQQFLELGFDIEQAHFHAYYMLNQAQGCATLLYSLKNESMFDLQLQNLENWLNNLNP